MIEPIAEKGYVVHREYILPSQARHFYDYALYMEGNHRSRHEVMDPYFTKNHHYITNDTFFNSLLYYKLPYIEALVSSSLYPTYSCYRNYPAFCIMRKHVDRDACEIGVSLCCGYPKDTNPWPFFITDKKGKDQELILYPGDAVIYLGCEQNHWRNAWGETWPEGGRHVQVFFHYVRKHGDYRMEAYDMPANIGTDFSPIRAFDDR